MTIQGKKYAGLATAPDDSGLLVMRTDGACDTLNYGVGVEGGSTSYVGMTMIQSADAEFSTFLAAVEKGLTGGTRPFTGTWPLRSDTRHVLVALSANSDTTERAALMAPRLHCSVNARAKAALPPL